MDDIEISKSSKKDNIIDIAKSIGINKKDLILYGDYKAKIKTNLDDPKGKLILVTAISPTPFGEGKTTVSIGLSDALHKLNKKVISTLREPSMGPVFGMKGGATGGGYSQVVPMEDINLHFTGDFHAITSANNLICAAVDNHIYFGNSLDIQEVTFNRCLDVNDRALRKVDLGTRTDSFAITSASEIMALFCLATSLDDLRERLGNIIVGINGKGKYVYVRDLNIEGSLVALLKDAFLPNLVQTLEHTPVIIHGGPFANIAHGCSSIVGTKIALSLEALKYHGGVAKDEIFDKNNDALTKGFANLDKHYENLKKFGVNVVVCLNKYNTDTEEEIELVKKHCSDKGYDFAISTAYSDGGEGAIDLAKVVLDLENSNFKTLYDTDSSIVEKINTVCKEIYGAKKVNISDEMKNKIAIIEKNKMDKLPVCIAKTQYSFSDDAKKVGVPTDFEVNVQDIRLYGGAKFITVLLGNIMVMPGLSRKPNCELIDVVDGEIINLS